MYKYKVEVCVEVGAVVEVEASSVELAEAKASSLVKNLSLPAQFKITHLESWAQNAERV